MLFAKNIQKKFRDPVLKNISIKVNNGEIIGIAGENGSGKSTLLSILAGLMKPDEGEIQIEGKIGYVPQEASLFDELSVRDNLRFWASAYGVKNMSPDPFTSGIFEDQDLLSKKTGSLSGGMKKRVSIALASLHTPDCLIMDEPTAALDIGFKGILAQMVKYMSQANRSVIFTSHQPDELMWCDRIYILRSGVFVYVGSPQEIPDLSDILYGDRS